MTDHDSAPAARARRRPPTPLTAAGLVAARPRRMHGVLVALTTLALVGLVAAPLSVGFLSSGSHERTYLAALVTAALGGIFLLILVSRQRSLLDEMGLSEERYRMVVETASHIIVTIAPSGHITTFNAATLYESGYTREDLEGRSFADFVTIEDVPAAGAFVARAFRGEESKFALRFLRKSGEVRWLEGTVSPIRSGRTVTSVLCICRDVTDERSAASRLRATDQRFRTIVDTSFEGIWTVDRDRRTDYVNRRLGDILGYTTDEMIGRDLFDFVPQWGTAARPDPEILRLPGVFELLLERKDGSRTWVIMSTSPLFDAQGDFDGALAMVADISQQKRVEQELRDAGDHLAAIIETQYEIASADLDVARVMELIVERTRTLTGGDGAAILLLDGPTDMVYRAVSGVTLPLMGVRMAMSGSVSGECARTGELVRCDDAEIAPIVDRELARRTNVRSVLAVPLLYGRQVIGVLEQAAKAPNFFTERDADTLRLMAGVLAAALGHAREFEEKKQLIAERTDAMAELQASQERFRTAFECSAVGMTLTAADGRFTQANRALADMLGYTTEELRQIRFQDITHPDDKPASEDAMVRLMRGEIWNFQMEKRYFHKNGNIVWVLLGVSVARDADGFPLHFVSQMVDITQRKRAEAERHELQIQLSHSSKMQAVGQLVSGVAHELNNPLAAILGFSEILLQDCKDDETRESLGIIFGQAQRSRAIVRDLLSFVRHREGRQRAATDMREMLDRVARTLMPAAISSGAIFESDLAGDYPTLEVDRSGLEQVFTNLVMNAVQAVGPGGRVRLSARVVGDKLEMSVEDSGPGIPDDVLPHLFEPFFTTKPVGQGTGLGLSVSLGIVEQHRGTLRAENCKGGELCGARFVVSLPIVGVPTGSPNPDTTARMLPRRTPIAVARVREQPPALPAAGATHVTEPAPPSAVATRVAEPAPPSAVEGQARATPHVLVIDDEAPIRNALRRFFERRGWVVDEACDGAHGLTTLLGAQAGPFDIMICDLKMPGVSGMELYSTLAIERPELLNRLIFATGDVASPDAAAFLHETQCPVLEKPYELSVLAETVERVRGAAGAATAGAARRTA